MATDCIPGHTGQDERAIEQMTMEREVEGYFDDIIQLLMTPNSKFESIRTQTSDDSILCKIVSYVLNGWTQFNNEVPDEGCDTQGFAN